MGKYSPHGHGRPNQKFFRKNFGIEEVPDEKEIFRRRVRVFVMFVLFGCGSRCCSSFVCFRVCLFGFVVLNGFLLLQEEVEVDKTAVHQKGDLSIFDKIISQESLWSDQMQATFL